ncbi:E3 ubiquitin-protein ligase TRIM56-like [Amphiura filiformis]|uniref:E3 ubiquitin-protein ligase TRIM56-like n=1 Tax=Amphiura filiformis TaxID=82378 RepID=UPI003B2154FB
MAAFISHGQRREDFKEEFLTCSICAESYDNDTHQAKCLPCLHTYCKTCLQTHAGQRPKFNCPKCRCMVTLPGGTVDSLPNNFLVENLKEYRDLFNVAIFCGSCDEENQAVGFCHDCGCFLCQKCMDAHERLGLRLQHKLSSLTELQEKKCNPTTQPHQCEKHSKQELVLFCKELNCKTPLCAVCGLVEHRGHELLDITAAVDEVIADIQQSSARVSSRNEELAEKRSATETLHGTLNYNFVLKRTAIQEHEQKLIQLIKLQCNKAQNHLDSLYQTQTGVLSSTLESIDSLSAQMVSACEYSKHACETSNLTLIFAAQDQIMSKLHELEEMDLPEITSEKTDFVFKDAHHSVAANIEDSLQSLCGIEFKEDVIDWSNDDSDQPPEHHNWYYRDQDERDDQNGADQTEPRSDDEYGFRPPPTMGEAYGYTPYHGPYHPYGGAQYSYDPYGAAQYYPYGGGHESRSSRGGWGGGEQKSGWGRSDLRTSGGSTSCVKQGNTYAPWGYTSNAPRGYTSNAPRGYTSNQYRPPRKRGSRSRGGGGRGKYHAYKS